MSKLYRVLATIFLSLAFTAVAKAAKVEDVFKGRIVITANRLPTRFASQGAFVSALRSQSIDKVWPIEEKGNEHAVWKIEYIAFFAQPLNDNEITVKFWRLPLVSSATWQATSSTFARRAAEFCLEYSGSQTRLRDEQEVQHDRRARRPCAGAYRILAARQGPEL